MRRICPRCQSRHGDDVETCPVDGSVLRPDPFIGAQIDRWTLTDFVGQGAMGVVYAAEPTAAIKILNARRAAMQPDLVRRFDVEAQAASRFESPHIARVFASGTTEDGHLFIAMELLKGEPLDAIIERSPRLPPAAAVAIGHQLAGALGEAHAAGVIHRDLKPANVFIEPAPGGGRHVRLLDFGVARINSESVARSRTGSVAGTPAYMSPEQLRGEPDIDGRSDIYSLGVVMYRLLSGVNPFRGSGGVMATLRRHLELTPPPIEGVSSVLDEVVRRMLEKSREGRPRDMAEVQQLLEVTGLVHREAASATIPGMSREFLAAVGVYAAAPDPEARPLVRALPDNLGQPALGAGDGPHVSSGHEQAGAAAGSPVILDPGSESETDTGDPPTPSLPQFEADGARHRRRRGWTSIVVVMLVLGVTAAVWTLLTMRSGDESPGARSPDVAGTSGSELQGALRAMEAEQWDRAMQLFEVVSHHDPDHDVARSGRERASREAKNQTRQQEIAEAVDDGRWGDAYAQYHDFPSDSVYAPRVRAMGMRIERGYADSMLVQGRQLIETGELRSARGLQRKMARLDFARLQADTLQQEIVGASDSETPAEVPAKPMRPETARHPEPAGRETHETPGSRLPAYSGASFDELITQALRRMMKSDRDSAIVLLKQAAKKRPSSHLPHQRLCAIYKAKQQYKLALSSCKKWIDREPNASYRPAIQRNIEQLQELINR